MRRFENMLVPVMGGAAGFVAASVLYRFSLVDLGGAASITALVALAATLADLLLIRTAREVRMQEAIDLLNEAHTRARADVELTRRALVELKQHVDGSIAARNDRVVGEVKVLEALIRRLAEGVAGRAAEYDPEPGESRELGLTRAPRSPRSPDDLLLEQIRRSLEENRVELHLQPVVSLPQRRIRFYEALSRLRTASGTLIMPSQYMRVAEPAGLMSVVDNVLLFRCVQVLRAWSQRNKDAGVFCNISRETLQDEVFVSQFQNFLEQNRELSGALIFEISQHVFETATAEERMSLDRIAGMGFTFSIDQVTSLDIDFAGARQRRVRHIKIGAGLLLGDPIKAGARVHPADLKELLARFGLNLVAERVEHEQDVLALLDYNVDFGQGWLFGEPRPIADTLAAPGTNEAARPHPGEGRPHLVSGHAA